MQTCRKMYYVHHSIFKMKSEYMYPQCHSTAGKNEQVSGVVVLSFSNLQSQKQNALTLIGVVYIMLLTKWLRRQIIASPASFWGKISKRRLNNAQEWTAVLHLIVCIVAELSVSGFAFGGKNKVQWLFLDYFCTMKKLLLTCNNSTT